MSEELKTGTTTLGLVVKDAIILAADRRATAGYHIVDKEIKKVLPVASHIAITTAGGVSDIQLLTKYLRAELNLKDVRTRRPTTVTEAANLLSGWVFSNVRQYFSGITHFILGGYDSEPKLYDIFPDGSLSKINRFVASGSGSTFALGLLENRYKEHLSVDEGVSLAIEAVDVALQRDAGSGNGITVYVIDQKGAREVVDKVVKTSIR